MYPLWLPKLASVKLIGQPAGKVSVLVSPGEEDQLFELSISDQDHTLQL